MTVTLDEWSPSPIFDIILTVTQDVRPDTS